MECGVVSRAETMVLELELKMEDDVGNHTPSWSTVCTSIALVTEMCR